MNQGWVCPKCGKVNAPWKESCDCVQAVPANPYQYPVMPLYPQPWYPIEPQMREWRELLYKVTC